MAPSPPPESPSDRHASRSPSPSLSSMPPYPASLDETSATSSPYVLDLAAVTARLKILARHAKASRIPFDNDRSEHYRVFSRALTNVLSTELALFTFAQIIDGLPTADVAWDRRYPGLFGDHPIEEHEDICPGVLDRARHFREEFNPCVLSFDPKTLRSFRKASPGSQMFNIRLTELVAVALHEIGTLLFQLGLRMHRGDIESIDQWNEEPPGVTWAFTPPRPTIFSHHGYLDHDVYPEGIADVVGYWAEDRIFGGVTVFDRGSEERAPRFPPNVYFHSCRANATSRYYQLTDVQQRALTDFLLADHPDPSTAPLPILADHQNVVRLNDELAILKHFYRDIWERKPPTREYLKQLIGKPRSVTDYPEYEAFIAHVNTFPTVTIAPQLAPGGGLKIVPNNQGGGGGTQAEEARKQERQGGDDDDDDDDGKDEARPISDM